MEEVEVDNDHGDCEEESIDEPEKQSSDVSMPSIPETDVECCESESNISSEASAPLDLSSKTSASLESLADSEEVKNTKESPKEAKMDGIRECVVDLSSCQINMTDHLNGITTENTKERTKKERPVSLKPVKKNTKLRTPTPRRSSRNKSKPKTYSENKSDSEIEEITIPDPLAIEPRPKEKQKTRSHKNNTIVVKDTKHLVELASGKKDLSGGRREPTLIIIDTQSILSGKGPVPLAQAYPNPSSSAATAGYSVIPISLPTKGVLVPLRLNNGQTSITVSESVSTHVESTAMQSPSITQLIPNMTDDMNIIEAPSFIVPYLYLKPSEESLKEYIDKLKLEIEKNKRENSKYITPEKEDSGCVLNFICGKPVEKEIASVKVNNEECDESKLEMTTNSKEDNAIENDNSSCNSKEAEKSKKASDDEKNFPDSMASDKKKNEDSEDKKESTALEKESKEETSKTKSDKMETENIKCDVKNGEITSPEQDKKCDTKKGKSGNSPQDKKDKTCLKLEETKKYFETPIGKFFMDIGLNLVQEHVQTESLRTQKRKRDREGATVNTSADLFINAIVKNLEIYREANDPFHFEQKKCEYCGFKTESSLVMAQHLETPHMRNYVYKCNFCSLQIRSPHDILFHMESEHCVRGRLERAPALHQCPNCTFEDTQKSKLTRHILVCCKRYKPEKNLEPPIDWAPPAKILRSTPKRPIWGVGSQSKSKKSVHSLLPKLAPGPARSKLEECLTRGRGRPSITAPLPSQEKKNTPRSIAPSPIMPSLNRLGTSSNQSQILLPVGYQISSSTSITTTASKLLSKNPQVSITPLPKVAQGPPPMASPPVKSSDRPRARPPNPPASFVVCEICDGYIKDLEQLRNHMQWIHKVKIHPKMIHNRPPLNCQKCQSRFFTDQGLERHLLGTHGLVTSSMQDAANRERDTGRCPICGRIYASKLLSHVNQDHNLSLRPAHLSYKCTVCTATFEMYKDFEHHVYSVHSAVAKRAAAAEKHQENQIARALASDTLLRPLKINDEVTVIPHTPSASSSSSAAAAASAKALKKRARKRPTPKKLQLQSQKSVQLIDLGDSPDEMTVTGGGADSDDEVMEMVRNKVTNKVYGERLQELRGFGEEGSMEKRAKLVTEEITARLETEENLKMLKELCKDDAELKSDDDHERNLQFLERLVKNGSAGNESENSEEKLEILKQFGKSVSEDAGANPHLEKCLENIKNLLVGEGLLSEDKSKMEAGGEILESLKELSKDDSTDTTGLVSEDGDKEESNKKQRVKRGKSPRKKSTSSVESVQSNESDKLMK